MKKQKMILLGMTLLSLAGFSWAGSSLPLGEQDGLTEQCEVRDYDAEKGIVRLMMGGGMTNCPFSSFSSGAQYKITGWAADKNFRSSSGLRINIREKKSTVKVDGSIGLGKTKGKQSSISYFITLENLGPSMMKDVTAKYRIFVKEQDGRRKSYRCCAETVTLNLAPGEKKTFSTRAVTIRDYITKPKDFIFVNGGSIKTKDRLQGVLVQLSKTGWDGGIAERSAKQGYVPPESIWNDYRDRGNPPPLP
jgi:hypothetical protein